MQNFWKEKNIYIYWRGKQTIKPQVKTGGTIVGRDSWRVWLHISLTGSTPAWRLLYSRASFHPQTEGSTQLNGWIMLSLQLPDFICLSEAFPRAEIDDWKGMWASGSLHRITAWLRKHLREAWSIYNIHFFIENKIHVKTLKVNIGLCNPFLVNIFPTLSLWVRTHILHPPSRILVKLQLEGLSWCGTEWWLSRGDRHCHPGHGWLVCQHDLEAKDDTDPSQNSGVAGWKYEDEKEGDGAQTRGPDWEPAQRWFVPHAAGLSDRAHTVWIQTSTHAATFTPQHLIFLQRWCKNLQRATIYGRWQKPAGWRNNVLTEEHNMLHRGAAAARIMCGHMPSQFCRVQHVVWHFHTDQQLTEGMQMRLPWLKHVPVCGMDNQRLF